MHKGLECCRTTVTYKLKLRDDFFGCDLNLRNVCMITIKKTPIIYGYADNRF